jgi:hypothetical protein
VNDGAAGPAHQDKTSLSWPHLRRTQRGRFELEFGWIGDFSDRDRELHVRVRAAPAGGAWIFQQREAA